MGPNEPFWRTNSSFSPALSRGLEYQFQSEGMQYGSNSDGVIAVYDSSLSSNSKESRGWVNGDQVPDHHNLESDGAFSYSSSPDARFRNLQLMPPPVQGVHINDYVGKSFSTNRTFSQLAEGTSRTLESVGSLSSQSDDSEYDSTSKTHAPSPRSFSSCCSFMSKPIHPYSFHEFTPESEESNNGLSGLSNFDNTLHSDTSGPLEAECFGLSYKNLYGGIKCGLCERLLSQRSPWGSRMVWSRDMPITGVLSCCHVYHAECLERITPNSQQQDPPCPLCEKLENAHGVEQWGICRLKNGLPRLRSLGEEGPSRVWNCGQVGDCVEGAIDVPKCSNSSSSILLRNRSRVKRQLSLKGNSGKERGESSKRSGLCSPRVSIGAVGCSSLVAGPALKRW